MIEISVKKNNNKIDSVVISGHSGYKKIGSDIVCASVSSISITTINAILRYNEKALIYEENDGLLKIDIVYHDSVIDILLNNMIDLLEELAKQYPKNVKINN